MPKEYINAVDFDKVFSDENGNPTQFVDHTSAKLSWGREGGAISLALVDFAKDPDGQDPATPYLNLDRAGVNRLIQTLRRARDSAFGKDA